MSIKPIGPKDRGPIEPSQPQKNRFVEAALSALKALKHTFLKETPEKSFSAKPLEMPIEEKEVVYYEEPIGPNSLFDQGYEDASNLVDRDTSTMPEEERLLYYEGRAKAFADKITKGIERQETPEYAEGYKSALEGKRLLPHQQTHGHLKGYKQGIQERNQTRLMQASGKKQLRFQTIATVGSKILRTNFEERSMTKEEIKKAGISKRANLSDSVAGQTEKPTLMRQNAIEKAFQRLHQEAYGRVRAEPEVITRINETFGRLLDELPDRPELKNISFFKEQLVLSIREQSVKQEEIDRATFADLVEGTSKKPFDVVNAPEYSALLQAYKDGSWKEGEERTITLSWFGKVVTPELYFTAIDHVFSDEAFLSMFKKWLQ